MPVPSVGRLRRALRTPPRRLAQRARQEASHGLHEAVLRVALGGRGPLAPSALPPGGLDGALARTAQVTRALGAWRVAIEATAADDELAGRVRRRARRVLDGHAELFGRGTRTVGRPPPWHLDWPTGERWPRARARQVPYAQLDRGSDVKLTWELSRLRDCVALAQAAAVLEDDECLAALDLEVRSWMDENPVGYGVNWACAMEVALRAVNLICVDAILLSRPSANSMREPLVRSLYQHGWFLLRNLEISGTNGNHFLADAVGLVWLGRCFAGIGEGDRWLRRGREMVLEAATEQVLSDGLDHEGALPYHVLVMEMFAVALAADPDGLAAIVPTLRSMADATCDFVDRDGRVPDIGDDDGGRVLAFSDAPSRDARRVLRLVGALVEHPRALAVAGSEHPEDSLWLLGTLPGPPPDRQRAAAAPRRLADGGVVVLGDGSDHVVVDVGPVGFRGIGGHGHLDAMSFEATIGGRLAVRDSGTGSYTGDRGLRDELRAAAAHNVVLVDGLSYAALGETLWTIAGDSVPEVVELKGDERRQSLVARQRLPADGGSAQLERRLEWRPGSVEWVDRVSAPAGARVEHLLQLPDDVRQAKAGLRSAAFEYLLRAPAGAELSLEPVRWSDTYASLRSGRRARVGYVATDAVGEVAWTVRNRSGGDRTHG